MTRGLLPLTLAFLPAAAVAQAAQTSPITVPAGTQLPVSIPDHLPIKVGQPIRAELLYPVYADNNLVIPAHTVVNGSIVALTPDHHRRVRARLGGDFTPFHNAVVRFDSILLPGGTAVPIATGPVTDGAPIYRLVAPPPVQGGLVKQEFAKVKTMAKEQIAVFTGPDKRDRLVQFVYSQLPYHPQRIAKATAWTAETTAPITIPAPNPATNPAPDPVATVPATPPTIAAQTPADPYTPPTWIVQAYLTTPISSETSKPGDPISATVAEPIHNPDGSIAVPQGSLLTGEVTHAKPARKFSRAGELRFSFRKLQLPGEEAQSVRASLTGADSPSAAQLAMDSEGQVEPKPQDKLVVPLILIFSPPAHSTKVRATATSSAKTP